MFSRSQPFQQVTGASDPTPNGSVYDGSLTESATFNTAAFSIRAGQQWTVVWYNPTTGTPVGTVALQGSIDNTKNADRDRPDANVDTWTQIASSAQSGESTITFEGTAAYQWLRVTWTRTSGSVNADIRCSYKGPAS